ncbi:MAG: hypothetical protein N3D85_07055 [Candidatus Bathyarchaeota archaeon]|nr:hypothetical protein [Candidatus Bathyarchaeota archaeon]
MRLHRLIRNKYGFSTIIAALILMLLAVAAGVVVYAYVMGWIGGAQPSPVQTGRVQFDSITAVKSGSNTTITMYVRNIGSTDLTFSAGYLDGVTKTVVYVNGTSVTDTVLPAQAVATVYITNQNLVVNREYQVKLVFTDGTTISQSVKVTT